MDHLDTADDFGQALRAIRERAGRSLREMADHTKLGVRTLEALERNQIDRLPTGIFRRAVVRAYAREVGLDPETAVKAFLARYPDALPPPGVTHGPIADTDGGAPRWASLVVTGVALGIVVALVAAAYFFWPRPAAALDPSRVPTAPARAAGR